MPTPPLAEAAAREVIRAVEEQLQAGHRAPGMTGRGRGAIDTAAELLGINSKTLRSRLRSIKETHGWEPDWSLWHSGAATKPTIPDYALEPETDAFIKALKTPTTLEALAEKFSLTRGRALDILDSLKARGVVIREENGRWSIGGGTEPAYVAGHSLEYVSRPDNTYLFGVVSDTHLGSKYERLEVLGDLYDRFARAGIERVFHAGNWIEGEASFNRYDIHVYGMDNQVRYLAEKYPQRPGIVTYAVSGDDHEGWYEQREGVDIGKYAEAAFRNAGRTDWVNLGFMEAHIRLRNANTGNASIMAVVHPGGGSAYALGYSVQRILESLEGGEKPAVSLYGHYHKLWAGNIRNVWVLQCGTTKDQDTFMRKKRLEAHVGGTIVTLEQDEKGAIVGFTPKMIRYFNRGYYEGRWSHSGPVTPAERSP